ncbi:MAG: cyclic nucleotide-binding domain-containing protein [Chloroflexi bacterium]|nr:MAG: cyclic nucleotide-binding domain-containing protein [Chloroflexota bacterium]
MAIEIAARVAFLKKIHLFYGLEDDELALIAEKLEESSVPEGGMVFKQGDKATSFYLIYGGNVRIVRRGPKGKEVQLARLVKGDYFGEMALVANRPRSGTVIALADTSLLVLSRAHFQQLYKDAPHLRLNLALAIRSRQLSRRLHFKWLRPDEVIYFLARKHPVVLLQNLILPFVMLALPLILFYGWFTLARFAIVALAASLSLLAILAWMAWLIIDWGNDYYIVTNQRVVWLEKVVGIYDSRQESPLSTILSVGIEANPFGRVLDFGDVIVRTFVGKIIFNNVNHPDQASHMVEEYWERTRATAANMEKEAMKEALRKRLGLTPPPLPKAEPATPAASASERKRQSFLRLLGSNTLKLRYESGDTVTYRKHWVVLIMAAWLPVLGTFGALLLFLYRLYRLAFIPEDDFISFSGGISVDAYAGAALGTLVVFLAWLGYRVLDWSNDKFIVTPEQIVDVDREPFGTETRNAAQLENILGTEYRRIGILGNIFNFGTVYITVGGTKLAFEDVIDPAAVQSDIDRRRMARTEKKQQAVVAAERERMAEWLVTYHRNAEELRKEEEKRDRKSG